MSVRKTHSDTCRYCETPLRLVYDDEGDQVLWRGWDVLQCKAGHRFVRIYREENAAEMPTQEAKAA